MLASSPKALGSLGWWGPWEVAEISPRSSWTGLFARALKPHLSSEQQQQRDDWTKDTVRQQGRLG